MNVPGILERMIIRAREDFPSDDSAHPPGPNMYQMEKAQRRLLETHDNRALE